MTFATLKMPSAVSGWFRSFQALFDFRNHRWTARIACGLIAALALCVLAVGAVFQGILPALDQSYSLVWILNASLAVLMTLFLMLAVHVFTLWNQARKVDLGRHLHIRLTATFSLMAAVPAILMIILSAFLFHYGVQSWFSTQVQGAIHNSTAVAHSYLEAHKHGIAKDAQLLRAEIYARWGMRILSGLEGEEVDLVLQRLSFLQDLPEAIIFDTQGQIYARSRYAHGLDFETIPTYALQLAKTGETVVITSQTEEKVRAVLRIFPEQNIYLYVGRLIDPTILHYLTDSQKASTGYTTLQSRYTAIHFRVLLVFIATGLILLMLAIWLGLALARQIVRPIAHVLEATEDVGGGDFSKRLPKDLKIIEFQQLASAFNQMTEEIEKQHTALVRANAKNDARRRLTENLLRGVSSGVIGIDRDGVIHLTNTAAEGLVSNGIEGSLEGGRIHDSLPGVQSFLERAYRQPDTIFRGDLDFTHLALGQRSYVVRIAVERNVDSRIAAILTIEDATETLRAQKHAAWSDIAKRIAHEIKNPLTPIQLSAERLQRKYAGQLNQGAEDFQHCTDTIIRHVDDIGTMVNAFSNLARMPDAKIGPPDDLIPVIEEVMVLQKETMERVTLSLKTQALDPNDLSMTLSFDPQQMRQAFTNIIKNAGEAIVAIRPQGGGKIEITPCICERTGLWVFISDNGPGFPHNVRPHDLLEPYITYKAEGTGLGLAIVKTIMDNHDGELHLGLSETLSWARDRVGPFLGGALLALHFPSPSASGPGS